MSIRHKPRVVPLDASEEFRRGYEAAYQEAQRQVDQAKIQAARVIAATMGPVIIAKRHLAMARRREALGLPPINAFLIHTAAFCNVPYDRLFDLMDVEERAILFGVIEHMLQMDPGLALKSTVEPFWPEPFDEP